MGRSYRDMVGYGVASTGGLLGELVAWSAQPERLKYLPVGDEVLE